MGHKIIGHCPQAQQSHPPSATFNGNRLYVAVSLVEKQEVKQKRLKGKLCRKEKRADGRKGRPTGHVTQHFPLLHPHPPY